MSEEIVSWEGGGGWDGLGLQLPCSLALHGAVSVPLPNPGLSQRARRLRRHQVTDDGRVGMGWRGPGANGPPQEWLRNNLPGCTWAGTAGIGTAACGELPVPAKGAPEVAQNCVTSHRGLRCLTSVLALPQPWWPLHTLTRAIYINQVERCHC